MPMYLYGCRECGDERDTLHSISEDPVIECDNCGDRMSRKPQRTSTTFKGEGFYSNDKKTKK